MPGHGPPPKDINKLSGHGAANKRANAMRILPAEPTKQPNLPKEAPPGIPWHPRTRAWWRMWSDSPLSTDFTDNDWSELLDMAVLHNRLWAMGDVKIAPELRLRAAKFGATPEDRARLRIQFAIAKKAEVGPAAPAPAAKTTQQRRLVGLA